MRILALAAPPTEAVLSIEISINPLAGAPSVFVIVGVNVNVFVSVGVRVEVGVLVGVGEIVAVIVLVGVNAIVGD